VARAGAPTQRAPLDFRAMQRHAFDVPLVRANAPADVMLSYFKQLGKEASVGLTLNK
jgi:hypothetical protein